MRTAKKPQHKTVLTTKDAVIQEILGTRVADPRDELEQRVETLQNEVASLKHEIENLVTTVENSRNEVENLETSLEIYKDSLKQLQDEHATVCSKLGVLQDNTVSLEAYEDTMLELVKYKRMVVQLRAQLATYK